MNIVKETIPSSKGNLATVIYYPKKQSERLAILCPGYLDTKEYKHLVGLSEELSEKGYTVVSFDPTGTWESEGEISDYTTTQCLEDTKNVLEYMLKDNRYVDILIGGHSRGGMVSVLYAAQDTRISSVVAIMPSSYRSMVGRRREDWKETGFSFSERDLPDDKNKKRQFRVPYSHVEDRDQYNVIKDVKKVKVPIIFIAGEKDELVPPPDVKEIFDNANAPKKFIIIPGIGHDYRYNEEEIKLVNSKILEQIDQFNDIKYDSCKALILPINTKQQIFIQDRRGFKKPDWGYFGGEIEKDEIPLDTVIREAKEELDIDIRPGELKYLGISTTLWNDHKIIRFMYLYPTEHENFNVLEGQGGHWLTFREVRERLDDKDRFDEIAKRIGKIKI